MGKKILSIIWLILGVAFLVLTYINATLLGSGTIITVIVAFCFIASIAFSLTGVVSVCEQFMSNEKFEKIRENLMVIVLFVSIALTITSCSVGKHNPDEKKKNHIENYVEEKSSNTETKAWNIAKNEVEKQLKSPSSAKFCSIADADIDNSGDTYIVKGYVDAENSFGAEIRENFEVKIIINGDDNYMVEYCYIG